MDTPGCHRLWRTAHCPLCTAQFDPPALAILFAAVGHHMARWRRMVVNAIGAGWIIVIGRALCADRVQFFLCNHAHVVSIGVLLARAVVVVHIVVVAVAVRGFSANGQRTKDNKIMRSLLLLLATVLQGNAVATTASASASAAATYLHRQKAMSRLRSSCGPL